MNLTEGLIRQEEEYIAILRKYLSSSAPDRFKADWNRRIGIAEWRLRKLCGTA